MVPFATHVANGEQGSRVDLPLQRDQVIVAVRRYVRGIPTWGARNRLEVGPIDTVVRIGWRNVKRRKNHREALRLRGLRGARQKSFLKCRWGGTDPEEAIRSIADDLRAPKLSSSGKEFSEARAQAGGAGCSQNLAPEFAFRPRRVRDSEAWREVVPTHWRGGIGNAGISWENPSRGRTRKRGGLLSSDNGFELVVLFRPRRAHIPAQSVVEGKVWANPPAVLAEQPDGVGAVICGRGYALLVLRRGAEQKIGEVRTGLTAVEAEVSIVSAGEDLVSLIE